MTDTTTVTATPGAAAAYAPQTGVISLLGTGDHVKVGRLFAGTAVLMFGVTLVLSLVLGIERLDPASFDVLEADSVLQVFSLQAVAASLLFLLPGLIGVGMVVVPRQVGAETVAFPRAALASYYGYLLSGALLIASFAMDGGPGGSDANGVTLFLASLVLLSASLILGTICVATTTFGLRAHGLNLERTPAFAWSFLVAGAIWTVSLGALAVMSAVLYLDTRYQIGTLVGDSADMITWIYWFFTPPQMLAVLIPVLGFALDATTTASGVRSRAHGVVLGAIAAFGALSFGAWTFQGVHGGIDEGSPFAAPEITTQLLYIASAIALVLPVLVLLGNVADGLRRGKGAKVGAPLVFGIVALLLSLAAVGVAAVRSIPALELVQSSADGAVAGLVLAAGAAAIIGAFHYWAPQLVGRTLKAPLALLTGLLVLVGGLAIAAGDLISGFSGLPFIGAGGDPDDIVEVLAVVSVLGVAALAGGLVLFVLNLAASLNGAGDTEPDPWAGQTLEWAADPAAVTVVSAAPLLDQRDKEASK